MRSSSFCLPAICLFAASTLLTSCTSSSNGSKTVHLELKGRAMGGEQPITAATIQMYAVGTTTDGGASTALINQTTTPVTTSDGTGLMNSNANAGNGNNTDGAGYFNITGDFTCPTATSLVYIASIGGNPGAGTNSAQEQLAALGQCGNLTATTSIIINEVTTVGTVRALSGYMTAYDHVGSTTAHASALSTAFSLVNEYVNTGTGVAPGPSLPTGATASDYDLRALANVVQSCVNSTGTSGATCLPFFSDAQGTASAVPTDTVTALLDIFADPTHNVGTIFNLQPTQPAFAPTNVSAPVDWTLPILQAEGTPAISPATGSYYGTQTVTIADSDTDPTNNIYYTTDGSTPSATNGTLYAGSFTVTATTTVKAIAIDDSRLTSAVASSTITVLALTTPTVSLSSATEGYALGTAQTLTATSTAIGSTVTFGTAGAIGGTFASPGTCVIGSGGTCTIAYTPSATLTPGTYTNDLTASFAAYSTYAAASAASTLTITSDFAYSVIHQFAGGSSDGEEPALSGLIQAQDGSFYYTTSYGGGGSNCSSGCGFIGKLTYNSATSSWTNTKLYDFTNGGPLYAVPESPLIQGRDGNFYGTTLLGSNSAGQIYQITPSGTVAALYNFGGGADGQAPTGAIIQGADGNFYGTTQQGGGSSNCTGGCGTVFQLAYTGGAWVETPIHQFTASTSSPYDGSVPDGGVIQGADGNLYGTTYSGGQYGNGTVYKIAINATTPASSTYTTLYSFSATSGNLDGENPDAGLVQYSDGNLYGVTYNGGSGTRGTYFSINPTAAIGSNFTLLFSQKAATGAYGVAPLIMATDGNLYTATSKGGTAAVGAVVKVVPNGASTTATVLHSFAGTAADGEFPENSLIQGADGSIYGMTLGSGTSPNLGTVWKVAATPTFSAPITLSAPSSVTAGQSFTLGYSVFNAYSTTLQSCEYFIDDASGNIVSTGALTGAPTTTNTSITAPATAGAYTLALTCGGVESNSTSLTVTESTAATPTFSPIAGTYSGPQTVSISSTTTGASIYYTTDGSTPNPGVGTTALYSSAITVGASETVNAIAVATNYYNSAVGSAAYTINIPPTVNLASISAPYQSTTGVTLTASSNATGSVVTFGTAGSIGGSFTPTTCTIASGSCSVTYTPSGTLAGGTYTNDLTASFSATGNYTTASASGTLTITPVAPTDSLASISAPYGSTTGVTLTASSTATGSVVTFGTAGSIGGSFTPTTCTIASGSCSVTYTPSGTPAVGTHTNDLTASFAATGSYSSGSATGTLTITTGTPTDSLASISATSGSTTGVTLTASSTATGSVVTFGTAGSIGGSFTPTTCTIASGSCSVTYTPSGTLAVGTYTNDLTASFAATSSYSSGTATGTLTINSAEAALHSFAGGTGDGKNPNYNNLIQGTDGNYYGMTQLGGAHNFGEIFELTPNGGNGTITVLYSFTGLDGNPGYPYGSLVQGTDGNFYGVTTEGGSAETCTTAAPNNCFHGYGTVFELQPNGTNSTLTILYSFMGSDGYGPYTTLVQGTDGNFYGTSYIGGAHNDGSIFELQPNGTNSTLTLLYSFTGGNDGSNPFSGLVQGADGNFYGTASSGGASSRGTIYELQPNGTSSTFTLLYTFTGGNDGANPYGSLVQGTDGNLYGMAANNGASNFGTIYELHPNGASSTFTVLHALGGSSEGGYPTGNLTLGSDGKFYGMTSDGGAHNDGTIFKLTPNGTSSTFTLLYTFTGGADGSQPGGSLLQGSDGNFYGMTEYGGTSNNGTIIEYKNSPTLAAPVTFSAPSSVTAGQSFTLSYAVSNAYYISPYKGTMSQCFAGVHDSSGNYTELGAFTGKPASQNTTLTAPSTSGTYTLGVTCGGQESSSATLTVP